MCGVNRHHTYASYVHSTATHTHTEYDMQKQRFSPLDGEELWSSRDAPSGVLLTHRTHTVTHTHTHTHTVTHTHTHTPSHTHSQTHTVSHAVTHTSTHTVIPNVTYSFTRRTHTIPHARAHTLSYLHCLLCLLPQSEDTHLSFLTCLTPFSSGLTSVRIAQHLTSQQV